MKRTFTKLKAGFLAAALAMGFAGTASAQTIFSESFTGTGIPTGWTNTPFIGTTGFIRATSGTSAGAFPGTFNGPTKATGYLLYDSDDNANATGDSVEVKTPVINATGKSSVFLRFNEFYAEFNSTATVQVSNNGTTWTTVHRADAGLANNTPTANPLLVNVDISSIAANQATVYVRFKYSSTAAGGAYWWFIDDVEVYSPVTGPTDLSVGPIYTLGKLPLTGNSAPHVVKAVIKNVGTNSLTSETVTLNVTGATTFTTTATISNLAAGASTTVTFPGYTPTTAGTNTLIVSVPVTNPVPANNSDTTFQEVTTNTISVAEGNPPTGSSVTGFAGTNAFYVRYNTNNSASTTIPVVRALIGSAGAPNVPTVGQTLYAVILDASGNLIARSANRVIAATDLGTLVSFPITTPPILAANSTFHAGLAQVGGGYFPLITQPESPARPQTYFTGAVTGGTLNPSTSTTTRFVIEADITAAPTNLNDASVESVYALGKVALTAGGNSSPIQARIKNTGTNPLTNLQVTAAVSTSTYNQTVTIPSLAVGQTILVNFPAYTANTPANTKTITVSLAADGNVNNNTLTSQIAVTNSTLSYVSVYTPDSYVGFGPTGNAAFLIKLNAAGSIKVNTVRAFIRDDASVVGKTVFAVVVDSLGNEIARSANVVLTAADRGDLKSFTITTPPTVTNSAYYVGLAQPTYTGAQYFPLGIQIELPQRSKAYYTWGIGVTPVAKPTESTTGRRYMIEADITTITGVKEELSANAISVYPNPSNGEFHVSAKDMKGSNLNLEVRDLQGKVVYSAAASKDNATVNLKNVAAGVYILQVSTDSEVAVKRLVVE
jgi:hypothetical protein